MEDISRWVKRSKYLFESSCQFFPFFGEQIEHQQARTEAGGQAGEEAIRAIPTGNWWLRPGWSQNNGKREGTPVERR